MDVFFGVSLFVLAILAVVNIWLSVFLTIRSLRRYRAVRPLSDRMSVGE